MSALEAIDRPEREFKPIFPLGWKETTLPRAMLVLVGGRGLKSIDWPAIALVFARGSYALGRTIAGSAFPGLTDLPRIFEGHQCLLEVGDEFRITKDVSTNGTFVIPSNQVQEASSLGMKDLFQKRLGLPCPRTVRHHDVLLTIYAELVLVLL